MINWMKFKWLYFLISALVIIPGLVFLILFGLNLSIDFTGGTLLEYRFSKSISSEIIITELKKEGFEVSSIQESGENTFLFRMPPIEREKEAEVKAVLSEVFQEEPEEIRFEMVGPTLGREILIKTLIAIVLATGSILAYVAWRFHKAKFGLCAILAMVHDSLVLLGLFSLMGYFWGIQVDTLFVTAILTTLAFSVYDTVVVYDRIRESQESLPHVPFEQVVNKAVTETISRSLNTSLTTMFTLIALILLGGVTIKWFAVALLMGVITGTYSSFFTTLPLLVVWEKIKKRA